MLILFWQSVEWDSLTAKSIVFLRVLFSSLFLEHDVDSIEGAFRRIAGVSGLEQMKDGLTLFFIQVCTHFHSLICDLFCF
jgi:hypothetical protein